MVPATKPPTAAAKSRRRSPSARADTPPPIADPALSWHALDLHLHTPASSDYQEPGVTALDILRRADERGLHAIAFTDHNSVRGFAELWREIEDLEFLEYLKRLEPTEAERLAEYRRLLANVLLLPGFEFTASFGFHILAIFPEGTSVRLMEHLLLLLGVPEDRFGSGEVGATTDVLRAYEILDDHGALVIGAHVNSTHGIAMQGLKFGGQTKIAYTQSEHLHALEVTDLMVGGHRRSTARFFNGTKPEYPRPMHCIQGSDAHRLDRDPQRDTNLGVGDRATEMLLPRVSFAAIKALLGSSDLSLTRPYVHHVEVADPVKDARAVGNTGSQAFHESLSTKRTGFTPVLRDIVALANTDGGTVFVGASPFEKRPVAGVADPATAMSDIEREVGRQISPPLPITVETLESGDKQVLAIRVPRGAEKPYAVDAGGILVRRDGESEAARRDEIVAMVREAATQAGGPATGTPSTMVHRLPSNEIAANGDVGETIDSGATAILVTATDPDGESGRRRGRRGRRPRSLSAPSAATPAVPSSTPPPLPAHAPAASPSERDRSTTRSVRPTQGTAAVSRPLPPAVPSRFEESAEDAPTDGIAPPSGVELLHVFEQDGLTYYSLHDLREEKIVHNVTRDTLHRLWRDAIVDREERVLDEDEVRWRDDYGLWRAYRPRGGELRFNLVYRGGGDFRVFYGVGADELSEPWRSAADDRRR